MAQRILVTAGANGIGLVIAKRFAADGARVHICDINNNALADVTAANDLISGTLADVSNADDVARLFGM